MTNSFSTSRTEVTSNPLYEAGGAVPRPEPFDREGLGGPGVERLAGKHVDIDGAKLVQRMDDDRAGQDELDRRRSLGMRRGLPVFLGDADIVPEMQRLGSPFGDDSAGWKVAESQPCRSRISSTPYFSPFPSMSIPSRRPLGTGGSV